MSSEPLIFKHDVDGVLRDFHSYAFDLFFKRKHPEYAKYLVPEGENTGWNMITFIKAPKKIKNEIDKAMDEVFFYNTESTIEIFSEAFPLVTKDEWQEHYDYLKTNYPDCRIVISTHQYFPIQQKVTIEWLEKNGIVYDDLIMTGNKHLFGGNFLLDDKPETIEAFHNPNFRKVGVLFGRPTTNYYTGNGYKGQFPIVYDLKGYREVIDEKAWSMDFIGIKHYVKPKKFETFLKTGTVIKTEE